MNFFLTDDSKCNIKRILLIYLRILILPYLRISKICFNVQEFDFLFDSLWNQLFRKLVFYTLTLIFTKNLHESAYQNLEKNWLLTSSLSPHKKMICINFPFFKIRWKTYKLESIIFIIFQNWYLKVKISKKVIEAKKTLISSSFLLREK